MMYIYVYELMWDECRGSDTPFGKSPDRKELRRRVQEAREQAAQRIVAAKGKQHRRSAERKLETETEAAYNRLGAADASSWRR